MVEVEIRAPRHNEESQTIESAVLALVRADGGSLDIYPPDTWTVPMAPVISVSTGKPVEPTDDPEEWARNLPSAYRSGDITAVIRRDDNPASASTQSVHEEEPPIPAPPMPMADEAEHMTEVAG